MQLRKDFVAIRFYDADMQIFYKGNAFIETLELTGDVRGFAKMKVSLQPSGPLTAATETEVEITNKDYSNISRMLSWDYNRKKVNLVRIGEYNEGKGIVYKQLNPTAIKNRITVRPKRALLNCSIAQLKIMLNSMKQSDFNNAMLVFPPEDENASVVVGPGTYVVVVNVEDQDGDGVDYVVMSSF